MNVWTERFLQYMQYKSACNNLLIPPMNYAQYLRLWDWSLA